jgi:hypothetical protein
MKEQYVKVISGIFTVLTVLGVLGGGVFWFEVKALQTPAGMVSITTSDVQSTQTPLPYRFWSTRTGKKYYPASCEYSQSIAESDRIYYATAKQAERYGKELSKRCLENL